MRLWRSLLISLLLVSPCCWAEDAPVLTFELATTPIEREWGLMGRTSLPENQGMLFIYPRAQRMSFWMFNTFIDLSIAFIDQHQIVCEMYNMKAYPEKMDPKRPVKTLSDMKQYPYSGDEMRFFREHSTTSKGQYIWALEVNAGWFDKQGVQVGDHMVLDPGTHHLRFIHPN
jgi:uncharacterized protein